MGEVVAMTQQQQEPQPDIFEDAWLLYPRHIAKKLARKEWARVPEDQYIRILVAIVAWRSVWHSRDIEFIPHFSTWLHQERWEDEVPKEFRPAHASHVQAVIPSDSGRTEMPDNIRAMLAKLRGK